MHETLTRDARGQLRRQLIVYFLTTFALSWGVFAGALAFGLAESPVVILGVWGPTLSAIIVTVMFYGKDGLKRFFGRFYAREGLKWFLPLLGFFLMMGFPGRFIGSAAAGIDFDPGFRGWAWVAQVMVMQLLIPGLGEEFGWRGFALQRLQHIMTPFRATLVIAFFHLLWHAPTYWLGQGMHNVPLIWAVFFLLPWVILFTWVHTFPRNLGCLAQLRSLPAQRTGRSDLAGPDHHDLAAGWPDGTLSRRCHAVLGARAVRAARRLRRPGHATGVRASS